MRGNMLGRTRLSAVGLLTMLAAPMSTFADSGPYLGIQAGAGIQDSSTLSLSGGTASSGMLKFKPGPAGGLVGGYTFENGLRPEIAIDYQRNDLKNVGGNNSAARATASLYYNTAIDGYYFYLGGGAGYARVSLHVDQSGGDDDYQPIYSAGTGFGVAATPHILLGVDYRYIGAIDKIHVALDSTGGPVNGDYHYRSSVITFAMRYSFGHLDSAAYAPDEPVSVVPLQLPPPPPAESGYSN